MTDPHHAPSPGPDPDATPVGWWDRAAILALGGAGCALSYDALQQMGIAIHVRPQLSYLFPLVIDGFIAYGIRALLVMSTAPLRARLYTWTLFATATTASIWANALHAVRLNQQTHHDGLRLGDHIVAVLSTIAPLALAGAVHLYILITRHHPTRPGKQTKPGADQPSTSRLVPVRTGPDGTIHTGPDDHLGHAVRADHTHSQDLHGGQAPDHGPDLATDAPDQTGGPQHGPADHPEAGPPQWTSGPDHPADHRADHHDGDQSGRGHGRRDQGEPVDREPLADRGGETATAEQPPARATAAAGDDRGGPADRTTAAAQGSGPTDHAGTAGEDRSRQGTGGPDHQADHDHRGDHPGGPADRGPGPDQRTGGPGDRADHEAGDHRASADRGPRTGPDSRGAGDEPDARTADRTTADSTGTPGEGTGLEELLSIAREAALAEGRMTRRALRPYLNQAGVPISNSRFTELQRRLYADPTLAHLPRPGRRTRDR
ncbi:DUF2637 domain-containing protein [Streptomyces sp. HPF1205]|uniref:DUF2637 domain-containing protein n=1 Tax=Streptomyces sp. HPF1205 TaxID=2873262 RepID=UPI0035AB857A